MTSEKINELVSDAKSFTEDLYVDLKSRLPDELDGSYVGLLKLYFYKMIHEYTHSIFILAESSKIGFCYPLLRTMLEAHFYSTAIEDKNMLDKYLGSRFKYKKSALNSIKYDKVSIGFSESDLDELLNDVSLDVENYDSDTRNVAKFAGKDKKWLYNVIYRYCCGPTHHGPERVEDFFIFDKEGYFHGWSEELPRDMKDAVFICFSLMYVLVEMYRDFDAYLDLKSEHIDIYLEKIEELNSKWSSYSQN